MKIARLQAKVQCQLMTICTQFVVLSFTLSMPSAAVALPAAPRHDTNIHVASVGLTRLTLAAGATTILAEVVTRTQNQSKPPHHAVTACTGSRIPCSLVSRIRLRVGKAEIFVPNSIVFRLADLNDAALRAISPGKFELRLSCGDASEAYEARILFDTKRVTQLDIVDSEAGLLAERTVFNNLSHTFDD